MKVAVGTEFVVYCTEKYRDKIQDLGFEFRPYTISDDLVDTSIGSKLWTFKYEILKFTAENIDLLISEIRGIDCSQIIFDTCAHWGKRVAELANIPSIAYFNYIAIDKHFSKNFLAYARTFNLKGLVDIRMYFKAKRYEFELKVVHGLKGFSLLNVLMGHSKVNWLQYPKEMQPGKLDTKIGTWAPSVFIYNFIEEDGKRPNIPLRKAVYVSAGTINKSKRLFEKVKELIDTEYTVYVHDKDRLCIEVGLTGKNIVISSNFDQLHMLRHCEYFITHAGMCSVLEAHNTHCKMLYYPLQGEQAVTARMAVKNGWGKMLKMNVPLKKQLENLF